MKNIDTINNLLKIVPDFPSPGIQFYDISPLLASADGFKASIQELSDQISLICKPDVIAAIDSRGFIFGAALAQKLGLGLILIRKQGKLPGETLKSSYELEYGTDCLEVSTSSIKPKQNILLIDDVLATGGTASAACKLLAQAQCSVTQALFLLEIEGLNGRQKLECQNINSVLKV